MSVKKLFLLVPALAVSLLAGAQNVSDLIISEVMPVPDSTSLVDDFGVRNGWVELFNTSQGTVNIGGCYLTDDRSDLRKSMISTLDRSARLGPRQSVVFYASGDQSNGTFYTSFKLRPGTTIYLVSNDGRTLVDSLSVPSGIPAGKSIAKFAYDNKAVVFSECKLSAEEIPQDGKYHAIRLGEIAVVSPARVYFDWTWRWSTWLPTMGAPGEKREVWASVKFLGPAYVKGAAGESEVRFERIFFVKP